MKVKIEIRPQPVFLLYLTCHAHARWRVQVRKL